MKTPHRTISSTQPNQLKLIHVPRQDMKYIWIGMVTLSTPDMLSPFSKLLNKIMLNWQELVLIFDILQAFQKAEV